ncbi:peptide MFS transporter [Lutibacter sp. TH_r2]|uniref:peptide MFS transporter n=1 Tax=Lutibacter sp. TH_r2 TaxID=3082083 RepID=UPI002952E248|nr:peptide MFS transporter [Lutibacter sp. TH_r2]MDV7187659.1 peptide MFS transporter [Lutibacter sp. TH_r2]
MKEIPFRKSHPKGLYTLFATEMWERFSYYGMRALLVLYLTAELVNGGFGLERQEALELYAIFTGLVYLTPILGGWVSDKYFGQRKTVYIGGLVMAIGQFLLAASALLYQSTQTSSDHRQFLFNFGLGVLIIGNGFFKPNISTVVGEFYHNNDPMKDSAFNIFYLGINLGAILGTFIAGGLGESVEWGYGFLAAGVGMILGVFWLKIKEKTLEHYGLPPNSPEDKTILNSKDWVTIFISMIVLIVGTYILMFLWALLPDIVKTIITYGGFAAIIIGLAYTITKGTNGSDEWSRMAVIIVLAIFNIVFWAGFEQAGGTFSLFAKDNTDRIMFGWEMPATWFQNVNSFAILIFASIFSIMWIWLDKKGWNPRTPMKFALGFFLGAIAFFVMTQAQNLADTGIKISPWWLVSVYVLLTLGELMLSPIGLSMITKLAPPKLVSVVMGLWMASFAAGNFMAGMLEGILNKFDYPLYPFIMWVMIIIGVITVLISPLLNKAMKGIH